MSAQFTSKQKEIIARRLGYEGPMQGFDAFIASSPALQAKFNMITDKFIQRMAKGGLAKHLKTMRKYADGGTVAAPEPLTASSTPEQIAKAYQWAISESGAGGGDTEENRAKAVDYLRSIGVPDTVTQQGYQQYLSGVTTPTAGTTTPPTPRTPPPPTPTPKTPRTPPPPPPTPKTTTTTPEPLTASSTPEQIAKVYQWAISESGAGGGDTPENRVKAVEYLRSIGVPDTVTQQGYQQYLSGVTTPTAGTGTTTPTTTTTTPTTTTPTTTTTTPTTTTTTPTTTTTTPTTTEPTDQGPPPLAAALTSSSSAADVAAAYQQALASIGGADTEENRQDAAQFFRSKGILDTTITEGYNIFSGNVQEPTKSQAVIDLENSIEQLKAKIATATTELEKATLQGELNTAESNLTLAKSRTAIGEAGKPVAGTPAQATTALMTGQEAGTKIGTDSLAAALATTGVAQQATAAQDVAAPSPITPTLATTTAATTGIQAALAGVDPATGSVTQQVSAATQAPETTALTGIQSAQLGGAQQVVSPAARSLQTGELIEGSAVSQERVQSALEQSMAQAAQGVVTEDMTTQGQLNKILANFDAGNPPAWAAGAMRNATSILVARGLGASSLAGQAVVQAAVEAALPIAAQDAQVFQQMGLQNLSNKQQMAVLAAQQRAAFLQQEFDQSFQTRVTNAARVSEIANLNFSAEQQIALENARLAQSVDLANLSNDQAVVMAKAAQIASLETANLNNRQQAAVVNAQSFLQMDLQNMANEQQTALFKAQQISNALLSDAAAANAASQFNATSQNQTDQFMASLTSQVNQFNVAQKNAIAQFNTDQVNALVKFNAEAQNARDQFNSTQRLVIDQANAQWLRDVSTANTAATNATNYLNAQLLSQMTLQEYNNEIQLYRDQIEMAWSSFEKEADRAASILQSEIAAKGGIKQAENNATGNLFSALAQVAIKSKIFG